MGVKRTTTLIRVPKQLVQEWDFMFPGREKKQVVTMLNDVFKIVVKKDEIFKKQKRS